MERYVATEKPKTKSKRIYLQSQVITPDPIIYLQQDLALNKIEPIPTSDLHLTLFHFGKPNELFDEIALRNPDIHPDLFAEELSRLLKSALAEKEEIEAAGKELGLFEKRSESVIVLRLQQSEKIREFRGEFLDRFEEFLGACGIRDISSYMQSSPNLKYQSQEIFDPHITIGFPSENIILPNIDVSGINLVLGSPKLANT